MDDDCENCSMDDCDDPNCAANGCPAQNGSDDGSDDEYEEDRSKPLSLSERHRMHMRLELFKRKQSVSGSFGCRSITVQCHDVSENPNRRDCK